MFLNAKKLILLFGFIILILGYFVMHGGKIAAQAASLETVSHAETIDAAVVAFQQIGTLRRDNPIDANAINEAYTGSLQGLVKEVDAANDLTLDSQILAAIDEIGSGNEPRLAAQVIDKTLQRAFYQIILNRITTVRDDFDTADSTDLNLSWNDAIAAFEAIKGTAARENKVIGADRQSIETGDNPGLDVQISAAFMRGSAAIAKNNPAEDAVEISIVRQIIRLSLARTYYIGVLREVEGIISNRDREVAEAREKQKEGEFFYAIIEDFIIRENATGSELIKAQFTGDIVEVNPDSIISELSKGFIGRVRAELDANESSISDNRSRAMEVAEEAVLYANVFAADLELRSGAGAWNALENSLNALKDASNAQDLAKAAQARFDAESVLQTYEQTLADARYLTTEDTPFVDAAISAFQTIGSLRRQNPVNAQAILDAYTGELRKLTQTIDRIYGLTMDNDVQAAIDQIEGGQQVAIATQIIDKTLQRVFALTQYNRITLVLESLDDISLQERELEWDRAYSAYQAIIGTAARENKVLTANRQSIESGSNPRLDSRVTLAFIHGKNALSQTASGDHVKLAIAREGIVVPMIRAFLIGVLREVQGMVEERDRDLNEALEKQAEGIFFYNIVESVIAEHNPNGSGLIKSLLSGNLSAVNADQIVSEISRGMIGKINEKMTVLEQSIGSDRDQALLYAEKVKLYVQILLPDLALRLDSLSRVKIENALQDLQEASAEGDANKASAAQLIFNTLMSQYVSALS
ncbi:MAG: hypothetical protein KDF59_01650 [Nitrosomonas sp.]|nr:hypothetical protein [Nitrosomonas sp.]